MFHAIKHNEGNKYDIEYPRGGVDKGILCHFFFIISEKSNLRQSWNLFYVVRFFHILKRFFYEFCKYRLVYIRKLIDIQTATNTTTCLMFSQFFQEGYTVII